MNAGNAATMAAMVRETQTLTVLFADITESSRLYQQLGDGAARGIINDCLSSLSAILPRFRGRLVKTLGDAIMCVFPDAGEAVGAAAEMQAAVSAGHASDHPLRIHIGLHAGPVLVEADDVFGDTVNAAAFLTNVAMADQILISDVTERGLPSVLKPMVRPLFSAVLKGSSGESAICQVLWRLDNMELTDVNLMAPRVIGADSGSLVVTLGDDRIRVDRWRPLIAMGRATDCDLVVKDIFASRRHCSIRFVRTSFYLVDHSVNGTYITLASGDEIHLLRGETVIEGTGEIRLGRSRTEQVDDVIAFQRDRRSQYRV
ncbi:MAG: adenylate/guanylate cyclase domain-containing protein [Burkholderiales bacterium]